MRRLWVFVSFFGAVLFDRLESRQMCLNCQYVENGQRQGIECATAPWNWTWGNTRIRCPYRCFTDAQFDIDSGQPLYVYRGCTQEVREQEGCHVGEAKEFCWSSCEGDDYCNDWTLLGSALTPTRHGAASGSESGHGPRRHHRGWFALALCAAAAFL